MNRDEIKALLEKLAGQKAPLDGAPAGFSILGGPGAELGYSQLNELLLLFGLDRITHGFFRYLLDGETEYEPGLAFDSADRLTAGVDRFRELAVLLYGNIKFGFKSLSQDNNLLQSVLTGLGPIPEADFKSRHRPILPRHEIEAADAYLTGYLIERELRERLVNSPGDQEALAVEARREEVVAQAKANQEAYLVSDHLDVYVATSMREKHEFSAIKRITSEIFNHQAIRELKLRWFDPTQAYCHDRVDKGLSEALMLRRASCTIYLAQESDTLGKDSELASTLAQGKPVVAYIPDVTDEYFDRIWQGCEPRSPMSQRSDYCCPSYGSTTPPLRGATLLSDRGALTLKVRLWMMSGTESSAACDPTSTSERGRCGTPIHLGSRSTSKRAWLMVSWWSDRLSTVPS